MNLTTSRTLLRPITSTDVDAVFRGLSHPEVVRYYGVRFDTLEATRGQMAWYDQLVRDGTGCWWAIIRKGDGVFAGAIGFNNIVKHHRRGEIGFWLLPEHQGRGYLHEVLPVVIGFGQEQFDLHRIHAEVETENHRSRTVLEGAGFHHEGTLRECEFKDGVAVSLHVMALLRKGH